VAVIIATYLYVLRKDMHIDLTKFDYQIKEVTDAAEHLYLAMLEILIHKDNLR